MHHRNRSRIAPSVSLSAVFSFLLALLTIPRAVAAGDLRAVRITGDIVVDGILDDPAWAAADSIYGFTQFEPVYNAPSAYYTSVRALYNDRMIYFAFICADPEPSRITAAITKRDDDLPRDDGVVVFLDTFHDKSNAYFFAVNPIGTQSDGRFTDNGRTSDVEWDTRWESGARIGPGGWTAEFAIPFEYADHSGEICVSCFRRRGAGCKDALLEITEGASLQEPFVQAVQLAEEPADVHEPAAGHTCLSIVRCQR